MLQKNPLTFRSRLLLLQLSLHCKVAQQQVRSCRPASTASSTRPAKTRTLSRTPQPGTAPNAIAAAPAKSQTNTAVDRNTKNVSAADDHTPRPLSAPLGLREPPSAGQNTGIDPRTWRQRRDDFLNYDKHLERRASLTRQVAKPFISPPTLIRAPKALYFPNLHGRTLLSPSADTTPLLRGKTSLVALFCGTWAERQAQTFLGSPPAPHPSLAPLLAAHADVLQRVDINMEDNALKAVLIRLFMPSLRRQLPRAQHARYFLVRRGVTDVIREALGVRNGKVGYVYLVDSECRIRWAGSGPAGAGEVDSLVRGVGRLVGEGRQQQDPRRRGTVMDVDTAVDGREGVSSLLGHSPRQVATG
ncbi:Mitochondrial ATPase complex subunit atp10 [Xylographa opegraphella]|nr:Mitochondrial ATPase complex subunit atp10 [Xylographa opegraphella]